MMQAQFIMQAHGTPYNYHFPVLRSYPPARAKQYVGAKVAPFVVVCTAIV